MATYYFWDEIEDNVVREYDENNNTIANYTTEPTLYGSVISQDRGGEQRYFQFDGLGNTTELTDELENVTDTRRYSAFGETTSSSGTTSTSCQFGGRWGYYTSNLLSPTTIRRRTLSLANGRWQSADPLSNNSTPTDYRFVQGNPLTRFDPSGLIDFGIPWEDLWRPLPVLLPVGIHKPGPCKLHFVAGHYELPKYLQLVQWLDELILDAGNVTGCGNWFGAISCESETLMNGYPEGSILPGFKGTPEKCGCDEAVDRMKKAFHFARMLATKLCIRRKKYNDNGCSENYQCGEGFSFCTSVQLVFRCDEDMLALMKNKQCPKNESGDVVNYRGAIEPRFQKMCGDIPGQDTVVNTWQCPNPGDTTVVDF